MNRRLVSVFAVGAMLAAAPAAVAQPPGDATNDGIVSAADVTAIAEHLVGTNLLTGEGLANADANGDGLLNAADLVKTITILFPPMISVPAGSFDMGDPWSEGTDQEIPVHTVNLSAFEIGVYEVTVAQYAAYLNGALAAGEIEYDAGDARVRLVSAEGPVLFETWAQDPHSLIEFREGRFEARVRDGRRMDEFAVGEVSWYGAAHHCNWLSRQRGLEPVYTESGLWIADFSRDGYHLPTEAQWERAAAWEPGHGHWRYGYSSDALDAHRMVYDMRNPLGFIVEPFSTPVGHYSGGGDTVRSRSPVGCYDMSGGVYEWCTDWFNTEAYDFLPADDPVNQIDPLDQAGRVIGRATRGGSWWHAATKARTAWRIGTHEESTGSTIGYRFARTS